jgi:hypothetical protein
MTAKDIRSEVMASVRNNLERLEPTPADWLVQAIVAGHDDITGADAAWHTLTAFMAIRSEVRHALRAFAEPFLLPTRHAAVGSDVILDADAQGELFDRLQPAYLVKRGKQVWLVPVALLTDAEVYAKADEYDRFGDGAHRHAAQLRRYAATR